MNLDSKILKQLKNGDLNKAAENLYQYFGSVYSVVKQKGASIDEAKDLFQDAIMVVIKKVVEENEEITSSLKTYITTICKYQWNNKINKLSNRKTIHITSDYSFTDDDESKNFDEEEARFSLVEKALDEIGEKCKSILNMFYINHNSMEEIAETMGFSSINSAKTQKYKCIEKARKLVSENTENSLNQ